MKTDRVFAVFYLLLLAVHLIVGQLDMEQFADATKPLLLLSIIVYYARTVRKYRYSPFALWILLGLVLSWLGDIALMFVDKNDNFFTFGLGAFLFGLIFYCAAFVKSYLVNHEIQLLKKRGWVLVLVAAYGFFFFRAIKDHLGDLVGPVIAYTMVLMLMLLLALNRHKKVSDRSFVLIAVGAVLFTASDSILAWDYFVDELPYGHILVMLPYGLAQLLIMLGALDHIRDAVANNPNRHVLSEE
ncbi:MAG TPA: lysoplasmalogenase [Cryomorphaceae bacterium]|nr:lysoplasmalogenase [Cryomorphaceae bacterium]